MTNDTANQVINAIETVIANTEDSLKTIANALPFAELTDDAFIVHIGSEDFTDLFTGIETYVNVPDWDERDDSEEDSGLTKAFYDGREWNVEQDEDDYGYPDDEDADENDYRTSHTEEYTSEELARRVSSDLRDFHNDFMLTNASNADALTANQSSIALTQARFLINSINTRYHSFRFSE